MQIQVVALAAALGLLAGGAQAGDPLKGESAFKRCRSCHAIVADDGTAIQKGGKTGPNLYGVLGRTVGSAEGFKYSKSMGAVAEAGLVWDEESLAGFVANPKAWLAEALGDKSAKSKMTFKLKKGAEDMAAYLAQHGAQVVEGEAETEDASADQS